MKISQAGIDKLKEFEGFSPIPYVDAHGFSIGYGHFILPGESFTRITRDQAEQLLKKDVTIAEKKILNAIKITLNQNQFDALVMFAYNTGRSISDLYGLINKKASIDTIKAWWKKNYTTSQGRFLKALADRRAYEADLFFSKINPATVTSGVALIAIPLILYFIYR
jgi:lysozyme